MPSGGGGGACRGHTNTNCTIEDTDDSFRWRRHSSSAQRRREAGLLDQSQQWANRNEDGGTGALPSSWRKAGAKQGSFFPTGLNGSIILSTEPATAEKVAA